jgi:probable HAF family extracellular repeat protein
VYVVFENKINNKRERDGIKMKAIIKMVAMVVLVVLVSSGNLFSQTATSTTQTVVQKPTSEVLSDIIKSMSPDILKTIYPPGFLDNLQSMGDSLYPPTPPVIKATPAMKMAKQMLGNGMSPMDNQQSDPPTYAVIDLGDLGSGYSYAEGINSKGQVVGYAYTSSGYYHAFLWQNGSMQDIIGSIQSYAYAINDNGQVVGSFYTNNYGYHAFLYQNDSVQDIGDLGGGSCAARGINNVGQITGYSRTPDSGSYYRAFLYSGGVMQNLGTFGSTNNSSSAYGINDSGQIIGYYDDSYNYDHAFVYSDGSKQDLGSLLSGEDNSEAYGINSSGQIVGSSVVLGGDYHAFLYENGSMQDFDTIPNDYSKAYGINNSGQIVGASTFGGSYNRAFLYSGGVMTNLNNLVIVGSGWTLQVANAINNNGQIVGYGVNPSGQTHAFLLTPVDPNSLPTIQAGKTHPAYGNGITQQTNKDSLIVITHGWIPLGDNPVADTAWVDTMSNSIVQYLSAHNISNWQVEGHKWIEGAHVEYADGIQGTQNALNDAQMDGINLGKSIVAAGNWTHVHLIAHSAGAELIQACSEVIRSNLQNTVTIQCTFLDPFTGLLFENGSVYGNQADWSDDYFTRDQATGGDTWKVTEGYLNHSYTVDVTYLDPNKGQAGVYPSGSIQSYTPCYKTETTHGWPIDFYMNTISGNLSGVYDAGDYGNFGFPLSEECNNWSLALSYTRGNSPARLLGIADPDCVPLFQSNNGLPPSNPMNIANPSQSEVQIEEGFIEKMGAGMNMGADDPAWLARFILVTNPVNYVAFDAQFTTVPQGAGELSVYWDTNAIGFADETLVGSGLQHYVFSFPPASVNSVHMLGFRLDDTSSNNIVTTISITNVIMAYVGVSQPFTLSFTTNTFNGLHVLQMTGEPGFNYTVQATTNLASTNWTDIAILVNSNG